MQVTAGMVRKAAEAARSTHDTGTAALLVGDALSVDMGKSGWLSYALADALGNVADAMDGMVPLPVGADGEPIRPGDGVWDEDGTQGVVTSLTVCDGCVEAYVRYDDGIVQERPDRLAHEHPDSFERVVRDAIKAGEVTRAAELPTPEDRVRALVARRERLAGEGR